MNITDGTVSLRALEPYDLNEIYRWENDSELWKDGASIAPFSHFQLSDYISNYNPDIYAAKQLRLMICLTDSSRAIGMIDLYDFDVRNNRCGVGIMIDTVYRGNGYASRSISLLAEYCSIHLGIHQLYSVAGVDNERCRKAFENCGFKICGRLRSWIRIGRHYTDAYMMQRLF